MMRQLHNISIAVHDITQDIDIILEEGEKLYGHGNKTACLSQYWKDICYISEILSAHVDRGIILISLLFTNVREQAQSDQFSDKQQIDFFMGQLV